MRATKIINELQKLSGMAVIKDPKFIKAVEQFVFTNDQKYISEIAKFGIPANFKSNSGPMFRGMILDQSVLDKLEKGGKFKLDGYSSWTNNERMAIDFVKDPKKKIAKAKGIGVIFKKKLPPNKVLLNIQSLFQFWDSMGMMDDLGIDELNAEMGLAEGETLCDRGLVLVKKDILKTV